MSSMEIFIIALGLILLLVSVFLVDRSKEKKELLPGSDVLDLSGDEEEIRSYVRKIMEQEAEKTLEDTDEKLSRLSNHKIMAVDEFSSQIIEKIDNNHQEAVFLYNMLQNKEKDIKETIQTISEFDRGSQQFPKGQPGKLLRDQNLLGRMLNESESSVTEPLYEPEEEKLVPDLLGTQAKEMSSTIQGQREVSSQNVPKKKQHTKLDSKRETDMKSNHDRILELHREKKSIMEISKMLGMGQGEVKLIIDLFGR